MNKFILLTLSVLFQLTLMGQTLVKGSIQDEGGEVLSFVSILIEGTGEGTTSDLDGNFELTVDKDANPVFQFSYLGYQTLSIPFTGQSVLNVVMASESALLDEVVVVGYGTQKKSDVTGAVARVVVSDAKITPTTNVAEMLRGKSAGVQVTLDDASPGGSSKILIRGKNSFEGGNDPLFIIDGVPSDDINSINVEDVASIEILKDASAQAIYGARASNGVILITTKRGEAGKLKVSYHGYRSEQQLVRNFDLYSGQEWADLRMEAYRSENNDMYEDSLFVFNELQREILQSKEFKNGEFVNWEDETINNATQQNHSLSFSTGTEKSSLYASFSYFDQNGIIPGSGYKRGTARVNIDHTVSDKFTFGTNIYMTTDKRDKRSGSLNFITLSPLARVRDENGDLIRFPTGVETTTSPLWNIRESTNESFKNQFQFTVFAEYKILKNLKYRLNTFVTRRNATGGAYETSLHSRAFATNGKATIFNSKNEEYLVENIIDYNVDINDNNRLDFTFVQSVNKRSFDYYKTIATEFPNDLLGYQGIGSAANILPVERRACDNCSYPSQRQLLSFMGRARYYLNDKYLVTLTARRDGSSVFAPGNKWGVFPSAAVAWKAHLEPFVQKMGFVNELKFRLSYGSIGNEAIAPYQTLGLASSENYIFGGVVTGGYQAGTQLFNPDLKWEESTTLNFGIDFGLFKNFLVGNFEVYDTKTHDLLIDRTTPGSTGYTKILSNIGEVQNKGVELGVTANLVSSKKLDWSMMATFANNATKILKLSNEVDSMGNFVDDPSRSRFIGQPIDVIYEYEYDGIWITEEEIEGSHMPDARPGDIRVKDNNGNGVIDSDDRIVIHKDPDWYGALSSRISFGGFDLYVEFYRVHNATKANNYLAGFNEGGTLQGVLNGIKVDYWTPENTTGTFPRPRRNENPSHIWAAAVSDASYTRLRTLSLTYHLPKSVLKKAKLSDVSIYGTATNLVTWTNYLSYSPEKNVDGYPDGQSFVFGIKINN